MIWRDVKLATLQKMFASDGSTIPSDESTNDYISAMPYVANEGIQMLATAGKYLVKSISISHNPIPNLLGDYVGGKIYSYISGKNSLTANNAKSFYFEITGKGTAKVKCGDLAKTFVFDSFGKYVSYKGIIANTTCADVTFEVNSDYPYAFKNLALYEANYVDDTQVPVYAEKVRYKMTELVTDFHSINSVIFEGDANDTRYVKTDEVYQEGDKVIAIERDTPGNYIVYYNALPDIITISTADDYELPLDREVVAILPLYMASQLYKDDDISLATQYRNEFEVAFERLTALKDSGKAEEVTSESGWI